MEIFFKSLQTEDKINDEILEQTFNFLRIKKKYAFHISKNQNPPQTKSFHNAIYLLIIQSKIECFEYFLNFDFHNIQMKSNQRRTVHKQKKSLQSLALSSLSIASNSFEQTKITSQTFIIFLFVLSMGFKSLVPILTLSQLKVKYMSLNIQTFRQYFLLFLNVIYLFLWLPLAFGILIGKMKRYSVYLCTLAYGLSPALLFLSGSSWFFQKNQSLGIKIFDYVNIMNIVSTVPITACYLLIQTGFTVKASNWLTIRPKFSYAVCQVLGRIFTFFAPFLAHEWEQAGIKLVTFFFLLLSISFLYFQPNYFNQWVNKANRIINCLQIVFCFLVCLALVCPVDMLTDNFPYILFSTSFFFCTSVERYKSYKMQEYSLLKAQELQNIDQAFNYLLTVELEATSSKYFEANTSKNTMFFKNIERGHQESCSLTDCQCKSKSKRKTDVSLISIDEVLKNILHKFQKVSFLITFLVLNVQLKSIQLYTQQLSFIAHSTAPQKKSMIYQFFLLKFQLSLSRFLEQKNLSQNLACIEKVMKSERKCEQIFDFLEKLASLKMNFWGLLEKEIIMSSIFGKNLFQQLEAERTFQKDHKKILKQFERCNVLLVALIIKEKFLSFKNGLSKNLQEKIEQMRNLEKHNIFKNRRKDQRFIEQYMFGNQFCTIESSIDGEKTGIILKVSKSTENIFGYQPNHLKGRHISTLMPKSMRKDHQKILINWAKTGSWERIGKIQSVFICGKNNACVPAGIYIKPVFSIDKINLVALCFRRADENFLIVNPEGQIEEASSEVISLLGSCIIGLPVDVICDQALSSMKETLRKMNFYAVQNLNSEQCQKILTKSNKANQLVSKNILELKEKLRNNCKKYEFQISLKAFSIGQKKFQIFQFLGSLQYLSSNQANENKAEKRDNRDSQRQNEKQKKDYLILLDDDDSNNRMIDRSASSQSISIDNLMTEFQQLSHQPKKIFNRKAFRVSLLTIILLVLCLCLVCISFYFSSQGFKELMSLFEKKKVEKFQNLFLLQIINTAINMKLIKDYPFAFMVYKEMDYQRNFVLETIQKDFLSAFEKEKLSGQTHFAIESYFPTWHDSRQNPVQIEQNIFAYGIMAHEIEIQNKIYQKAPEEQMMHILKILSLNYQQVKKIKESSFNHYQQTTKLTSLAVARIGIFKIILSITLVSFMLLARRNYHNFRYQQNLQILHQFGKISKQNCIEMKAHFKFLIDRLIIIRKQSEETLNQAKFCGELQKISEQFKQIIIDNYSKNVSNLKIVGQTHRLDLLIYAGALLLTFGLTFFVFTCNRDIAQNSQKLQAYQQQLGANRDSIIQNYLDFKIHILFHPSPDPIFMKQLLDKVRNHESSFGNIVSEIANSIDSIDAQLSQQFLTVYVKDACEQMRSLHPSFSNIKCLTSNSSDIVNFGAFHAMRFVSRLLMNQLELFNKQGRLGMSYFQFIPKVDGAIFILLQISNKADAIMAEALSMVISSRQANYLLANVIEITQYSLCILAYLYFLKREKSVTAKVYGTFCLIPIAIIKATKGMVKRFIELSNFDKSKI